MSQIHDQEWAHFPVTKLQPNLTLLQSLNCLCLSLLTTETAQSNKNTKMFVLCCPECYLSGYLQAYPIM